LEIVAYSSAVHRRAVERFNARLAASGSEFLFPTQEPEPRANHCSIWAEHFVATQDDEVLGGYILKHQTFWLGSSPVEVGNLQLPVSLGLIDNNYSHVSVSLFFDALGRNEFLYCLGMGSQESKLVKLLTAAGWQHLVVPFYFRVRSANSFARNIRLPPNRARLQRLLRIAGWLRLAGAGLGMVKALRGGRRPDLSKTTIDQVPCFDQSADELFEQNGSACALIGDRRAGALNGWYPEANPKFLRLVVRQAGQVVGWAVLLDTQMQNDKYFGNLRVGALVDELARPGHAATVVAAADRFLSQRGVELLVSNQLHPEWGEALIRAGYRQGPSNFFFYFSRELADRLAQEPNWEHRIHLNRGDGDGPIHL
jgi:hypothetical protein